MLLRINLFVCVFVRALNHFYLFWAAYVLVLGRRGLSVFRSFGALSSIHIHMDADVESILYWQATAPIAFSSTITRLAPKIKVYWPIKDEILHWGSLLFSPPALQLSQHEFFFIEYVFFIANRTAVQRFLVDFLCVAKLKKIDVLLYIVTTKKCPCNPPYRRSCHRV